MRGRGPLEMPVVKFLTMSKKYWLIGLSVVILVAALVLASSLHDVRFQPGRSFSAPASVSTSPPVTAIDTVSAMPLWQVLLFWGVLLVNVIVLYWLMPPAVRKRILQQTIYFALTALAIMVALHYRMINLPGPEQKPVVPSGLPPAGPHGNGQLPAFAPPHVTPWWMFLISFVVSAAILAALWLAYRWWMRSTRRDSGLGAIEAIARTSLGEIASGRVWSDVIIQSYLRMSEAVSTGRGLHRTYAMTPREFAERLEQNGLPAHAVQRLTRLFESARYGARNSSQSDINEAVACLNSILQACGQAQ